MPPKVFSVRALPPNPPLQRSRPARTMPRSPSQLGLRGGPQLPSVHEQPLNHNPMHPLCIFNMGLVILTVHIPHVFDVCPLCRDAYPPITGRPDPNPYPNPNITLILTLSASSRCAISLSGRASVCRERVHEGRDGATATPGIAGQECRRVRGL